MVKWTEQQQDAIYSDGQDILVAAAAGSGKTAVLVERIIQKLLSTDNPVDIDSLLVVTFTNAAAQEMRNRVGHALEDALAKQPTSNHLKKQLSLLQRASISTLHSFCMEVVRQYAYLIDIDPAFRIATEMEIDLMKQDVIDELFEEWYGQDEEIQEKFFAVVDRFSSDRSDMDVEQLILDLYTFSRQNPWPNDWLNKLAEDYEIGESWAEHDISWLNMLKQEVSHQFQAIQMEVDEALRLAMTSEGPYHYVDAIQSDFKNVTEAVSRLHSWEELQAYMAESTFKRLSGKRVECNEDTREKVRELRDRYRKRWNDMKNKLFRRDLASHINDMREIYPVIKHLTGLVKQFSEHFSKHKQEQGVLDFSDLEHFCLQLLVDESSSIDEPKPSKVAKQFKDQFSEVLVDEYQDTNLVQETILTLLSDQEGKGNMFMVGDVKQSIYRFRHAEPALFIEKYNRFAEKDLHGKRIDLASNFRSREHVLTGANYIFRQIFDEQIGEIKYDQDAELIYANKMYEDLPYLSPQPELIIIDREAKEESNDVEGEDYQDLEHAQLEARTYAQKIKQWIGQNGEPLQVVDKESGMQRNMQYRDVVILLRSMTWAPTIVDELKRQGVPVYAELSTGYFEAIEIKVMLSLLKVIDNPQQDIPLASVLKSPIVGLDEEELAVIRLADERHSFYEAVRKYVQQTDGKANETAKKVQMFLKQLQQFRFASRQGALSELIWEIYRETGFYDFVGGIPGGRQRQANLRALYDRARGYETTSFRGLFRFLRFIERMEERGDDLGAARALSEQEDVVRIMTIHKSKGLEFPVVIVGGMARQFNFQDLRQKYLLHKDLGFASKYIDPIKRITFPTLFYHALQREKLRELLSEEMRVLYVALTRAKEKLVMIGNVASFEDIRAKWQDIVQHDDWILPIHLRLEAKTYLDWVGPALMRHEQSNELRIDEADHIVEHIYSDPSRWEVVVMHGSDLANLEQTSTEKGRDLRDHIINWKPLKLDDQFLTGQVEHRMAYEYPYVEAVNVRAKQTVTEIKRMHEPRDEYSGDQLVQKSMQPIAKRPLFMQKDKQMTAAEVGTAMHTIMQHLPFQKELGASEIEEFIEVFIDREIFTREEANVIDITAIEQFYKTEIAQYMMKVDKIYREVPFSLSLPASEVYPSWDAPVDERVLIQGVIDCVIPTGEGWIILDYKTDMIHGELTNKVKEDLKQRYETQMKLYKRAVETIWREPIIKTYVYYFTKQLLVEV